MKKFYFKIAHNFNSWRNKNHSDFGMEVYYLFISARPHQWIKNLIIFAALIFSKNLFNLNDVYQVVIAFVIFCLLSSTAYLINDIIDIEGDKKHPEKRKRPIASGKISSTLAIRLAFILGLAAILAAFQLNQNFGLLALAYLILLILYSSFLKKIVILDVLVIAFGFVLRVIGGAVIISVDVSEWLLVSTIVLALFLALTKRRGELILLEEKSSRHRKILSEYNLNFLDQMIAVVTATTIMAYALYTVNPEIIEKFGTDHLIYTLPIVIYGIFRYLYLVYRKDQGDNPTRLFLTDIPLIIDILVWLGSIVAIIYFHI